VKLFVKSAAAAVLLISTVVFSSTATHAAPPVTHIAGGFYHSIFSKSDGSLWTMGDNGYGQLGIGFSPVMTNVPQLVVASGVGSVAAGELHTLFRMGTSLWVMGANPYGELGDGTTTNHPFPERIFFGTATTSVSALGTGSMPNQTVFATTGISIGSIRLEGMGLNVDGELGDGSFTNHLMPEIILSPVQILSIGCGSAHTLFVESDGSLWSMGDNQFGELGVSAISIHTNRPILVVSTNVTTTAAGGLHSLFIKSDSSLWGMGYNNLGQLGENTTTYHRTPFQIASNVVAVAGGGYHSLFIKSDGSLWAMGQNNLGQLGDGTTNDHHFPIQIVASNVVAVTGGYAHSLFIKSDGSLWGMGDNSHGQLGGGNFATHLTPYQIVAGPPPAPTITSIHLSGANLNLTGANGVSGETLYTLMSADALLPLSQWQRVATNTLAATGTFSITATNAVAPNAPQRFYVLLAQ
jgi:alpha-tubulin suppressor-like RCC1 family protein